jgi:hypothetical protein
MYNDVFKWNSSINSGGPYENDAALSDIVSALSGGILRGMTGHGYSYWKEDTRRAPMEIFANLVAIKTMKSSAWAERDGMLKNLFDALEGII